MNIQNHVPTLETCKRMKELGWGQEHSWYWTNATSKWYYDDEECYVQDEFSIVGDTAKERWVYNSDLQHAAYYSASISSEIMEELPQGTSLKKQEGEVGEQQYLARGYKNNDRNYRYVTPSTNQAEALALLWISLKEQSLI